MIYFDNAATTKVRGEVIEKMAHVMSEAYGNPSSSHAIGRGAAAALNEARAEVAKALSAKTDEVYFTSGGTESDNWALFSAAKQQSRLGTHIITSVLEHDAVLKPIGELEKQGYRVTYLKPDSNGVVTANAFSDAVCDDTVLVSLMLVNNETGVINPVSEYAAVLKRLGSKALLHTDAVQAFCKIPFKSKETGADFISVSAHKIHGAKGAGALYVKKGVKVHSLLFGGLQERGVRSGTEALPAIAGFGEAARLSFSECDENYEKVRKLRSFITAELKRELPDVVFIPGGSPYLLGVSLPGYNSEVLINYLDGAGICASKSAACKKGGRSRVLEGLGLSDRVIDGAIRLSFSHFNTLDECKAFVKIFAEAAKTLLHR